MGFAHQGDQKKSRETEITQPPAVKPGNAKKKNPPPNNETSRPIHRVLCTQLQFEAERRSSYSKEAQQALDLATHQWQSSMMTPKYLAAAAATAMDEKYREPTRRASTSDLVCRGPMAMHRSLQNGTSSGPGHLKTEPPVQRQRRGSAKTWTATWSSEVVNTNRVKPSSAAWGYVWDRMLFRGCRTITKEPKDGPSTNRRNPSTRELWKTD